MSADREWVETLDCFEAGLDHHARVLELARDTTAAPDEASPWPPAHLPSGPIPAAHVERAQALARRCDDLQDDVVGALAEAVNPPRRAGARPNVGHGQRSTLDHPRISIDL